MKNLCVALALVAASMSFSTMALSEEKTTGLPEGYDQYKAPELNSQKDICLIMAKNCSGGEDHVLKRVDRLNKEIEKGASVYSPEELKNFQEQLNWIYYESNEFPAIRL